MDHCNTTYSINTTRHDYEWGATKNEAFKALN